MAVAVERARAAQVKGFLSGNEMAALSAEHIGFHLMGYYPITPSTEIAEILDKRKAEGAHTMVMIPADGEHGAAGICYGAAVGGGRVFNATSAQGLLYALEQLPGAVRHPLPDAARPRDAHRERPPRHPRRPLGRLLRAQHRLAHLHGPRPAGGLRPEHLRAPRRRARRRAAARRSWRSTASSRATRSGACTRSRIPRSCASSSGRSTETVPVLDPRHPVTVGPYMNDPDLINNKFQLSLAMDAARDAIPEVFAEYERLSGRHYGVVDRYRMDDADVALLLLNSAAETAKDAADRLREAGVRAGVASLNVLRPFPAAELREALRGVQGARHRRARRLVRLGRRQHLPRGQVRAQGRSRQPHGVRDADLRAGRHATSPRGCRRVLPARARRGGQRRRRPELFDYYGVIPGDPTNPPKRPGLPPLTKADTTSGLVHVEP